MWVGGRSSKNPPPCHAVVCGDASKHDWHSCTSLTKCYHSPKSVSMHTHSSDACSVCVLLCVIAASLSPAWLAEMPAWPLIMNARGNIAACKQPGTNLQTPSTDKQCCAPDRSCGPNQKRPKVPHPHTKGLLLPRLLPLVSPPAACTAACTAAAAAVTTCCCFAAVTTCCCHAGHLRLATTTPPPLQPRQHLLPHSCCSAPPPLPLLLCCCVAADRLPTCPAGTAGAAPAAPT